MSKARHFCGWCLRDCGQAAHAHVRECRAGAAAGGREYFGDRQQFEAAQRGRRAEAVRAFLETLPEDDRPQVRAACRRELADLGIRIGDDGGDGGGDGGGAAVDTAAEGEGGEGVGDDAAFALRLQAQIDEEDARALGDIEGGA